MRRRTLQLAGVSVGILATIHERVHIDRRVAVTIGDRVDIRDRVRIGIAESGARAGRLDIGAGTVILSDTQIDCSAWVRVGSGTHVGRRAQIFTHSHDTSRRDVPVLDAPITVAPVAIGDDVMIYNDVVILPGVTIGNGAVVAIYKMSQCDKCSMLSKHDDFGYQKGYDATEKIIWFCGGCR